MSPLIAYHYNTTYTGYTSLENDHCRKLRTAEPYIYALEHDGSVFSAMLLLGMYKDRLARAESENGWFEYAKDATEALFEHIRRREFTNRSISRLHCCYYVASLEEALRLGLDDWGNDSALKILEVEIDDRHVMRYDQAFYNQAYELFVHYRSEEDIRKASGLARRYFAGEMSAQPLPELLADGENRIRRVFSAVELQQT